MKERILCPGLASLARSSAGFTPDRVIVVKSSLQRQYCVVAAGSFPRCFMAALCIPCISEVHQVMCCRR
uniref:Uncharacterized protein n=1 Tax=Arundo donax TaxID=35708 RepID=A0A0A9RY34_ARUDO